ncbi:MAG: M48 family metallopeptidase [Caldilineaceae bacterium]|nr:M48 family metallopeptidase [Caldilineaceae bacterium]MCB0094896.1 M48 family metallopeptidase [Caldilineaceae bacterium]MCB0140860.1 M48 family metallopeptidase [Caldilineaceae bacterium]
MEIKIIRSRNRSKTIQARMVQGVMEVRAPAGMSDKELQPHIERLRRRLERKQARKTLDDVGLEQRAQELNQQYFGGKLKWNSIRWVTNQNKRYGSCTPADKTIRISHRIASMPAFVRDYIIVHELAHLLEANHGPDFWKLVYQYERTERARGYLMAVGIEDLES